MRAIFESWALLKPTPKIVFVLSFAWLKAVILCLHTTSKTLRLFSGRLLRRTSSSSLLLSIPFWSPSPVSSWSRGTYVSDWVVGAQVDCQAELGTRQRDYLSSLKVVGQCSITIFNMATPFRHRHLNVCRFCSLVLEALLRCRNVVVAKLKIVACPALPSSPFTQRLPYSIWEGTTMVGGVNVQPPGSNLRERRGNGHRSEHYTAPEPADPGL